jgi:hypothetical protein
MLREVIRHGFRRVAEILFICHDNATSLTLAALRNVRHQRLHIAYRLESAVEDAVGRSALPLVRADVRLGSEWPRLSALIGLTADRSSQSGINRRALCGERMRFRRASIVG